MLQFLERTQADRDPDHFSNLDAYRSSSIWATFNRAILGGWQPHSAECFLFLSFSLFVSFVFWQPGKVLRVKRSVGQFSHQSNLWHPALATSSSGSIQSKPVTSVGPPAPPWHSVRFLARTDTGSAQVATRPSAQGADRGGGEKKPGGTLCFLHLCKTMT